MISSAENPGYGNCRAMETVEKQTAFFHRSHSAWKTRPRMSSFPQFPQPLRLSQSEQPGIAEKRGTPNHATQSKNSLEGKYGPSFFSKILPKGFFDKAPGTNRKNSQTKSKKLIAYKDARGREERKQLTLNRGAKSDHRSGPNQVDKATSLNNTESHHQTLACCSWPEACMFCGPSLQYLA